MEHPQQPQLGDDLQFLSIVSTAISSDIEQNQNLILQAFTHMSSPTGTNQYPLQSWKYSHAYGQSQVHIFQEQGVFSNSEPFQGSVLLSLDFGKTTHVNQCRLLGKCKINSERIKHIFPFSAGTLSPLSALSIKPST